MKTTNSIGPYEPIDRKRNLGPMDKPELLLIDDELAAVRALVSRLQSGNIVLRADSRLMAQHLANMTGCLDFLEAALFTRESLAVL